MNNNANAWRSVLPYLVGGAAAVAVYLVPEARPIACGVVASVLPQVM